MSYCRLAISAELTGSAVTRREALIRILPLTTIGDRCSVTDRHVNVRGKLRNYRIHIGSGSVFMLPNDRYLEIVPLPDGASRAEMLFLPFEESKQDLLSVIVNLAFILADDESILDERIATQIREG